MTEPSVSEIMPTLNGTKYHRDRLSSVLQQTYANTEVIVVDNASENGSPEFVEEKFPSVRLIKNSSNLGYAGKTTSVFVKPAATILSSLRKNAQAENILAIVYVEYKNSDSP